MSIVKGGIPENTRIQRGLERSPKLREEAPKAGAVPFSELLESRLRPEATKTESTSEALKFSAHAQTRLQSRGIELSPEEMLKLQEAVAKVKEKGSRESLILTDKAAFIVSVNNRTVITAMDRETLKENVFTNIDSTMMI